jgi:hypothetical protein
MNLKSKGRQAMSNVAAVVAQIQTGSTSTPGSDAPRPARETQATNYLFGLLAVVFGSKKMTVTFPDEMLVAAKRMYASQIAKYDRDEINKGIEFIKDERSKGNPDFEWPNLDRIIGSIRDANRVRALHRPFETPAALIGHNRAVAKEAGEIHLAKMRAMF